jgi:hypothetical protein
MDAVGRCVSRVLAGAFVTLNDIGRMLKLAKVPRSKVIQTTYPNPAFVVLVPMTHYFVIANVVGQLKMLTDNVTVKPLTDERDVRSGEHVYVKVTGDAGTQRKRMKDETCSMYAHRRAAFNRNVVVECVSVIS